MSENKVAYELYFDEAIRNGWRMSWQAWQCLVLEFTGWGVIDDDSGVDSPATVLDGYQARAAFNRCTVGPARCFAK